MIREWKERKKVQGDPEVSNLGDQWNLWPTERAVNSGGLCTFEKEL